MLGEVGAAAEEALLGEVGVEPLEQQLVKVVGLGAWMVRRGEPGDLWRAEAWGGTSSLLLASEALDLFSRVRGAAS